MPRTTYASLRAYEDALWLNDLRAFEKAQLVMSARPNSYRETKSRAEDALARADAFRDMRRSA